MNYITKTINLIAKALETDNYVHMQQCLKTLRESRFNSVKEVAESQKLNAKKSELRETLEKVLDGLNDRLTELKEYIDLQPSKEVSISVYSKGIMLSDYLDRMTVIPSEPNNILIGYAVLGYVEPLDLAINLVDEFNLLWDCIPEDQQTALNKVEDLNSLIIKAVLDRFEDNSKPVSSGVDDPGSESYYEFPQWWFIIEWDDLCPDVNEDSTEDADDDNNGSGLSVSNPIEGKHYISGQNVNALFDSDTWAQIINDLYPVSWEETITDFWNYCGSMLGNWAKPVVSTDNPLVGLVSYGC